MGMTPDEYWHGSPELTIAYRDAYKLARQERNWDMWLQGWYIYRAISAALSQMNGGKDRYLEEPIEIFPHEETAEEKEERLEKEAQELKRKLNAFAESFNARH